MAVVAFGLVIAAAGVAQARTPAVVTDNAVMCETAEASTAQARERPRLLPCWTLAASDAHTTSCPSERPLLTGMASWPEPPLQRPEISPSRPIVSGQHDRIEPPPPKPA